MDSRPSNGILQQGCKKAFNNFLAKLEITIPKYYPNAKLAQLVYDIVESWDLGVSIRHASVTGIVIADTAYAHLQTEAQLLVAIFTTLVTYLDDPASFMTLPCEDFIRRYLTGLSVDDVGMLGELPKILRRFGDHYSPYATIMITNSTMEWFNINLLENTSEPMILHPDASPFIEYRRIKTGLAEGYAHLIWERSQSLNESAYIHAIPDVMLFVNYANDILSFYKEELNGETSTYMTDLALVTHKPPLEALQEVIDRTVDAVQRARRILGMGEARYAFEGFVEGYIAFHFCDPRYRLREVIGPEYLK